MNQIREACVHLSDDKTLRELEIIQLANWFASLPQRWVFHRLSDATKSLATALENCTGDNKEAEDLKGQRSPDERKNPQDAPIHVDMLQIAIDQFQSGMPTRLVLFESCFKTAVTNENGSAVWAVRIDPLEEFIVSHDNYTKPETSEQVCKRFAKNLFASIGSERPSIYPPWIIPVHYDNDKWFLIPCKNEKFIFNLEQALQYRNEKLLSQDESEMVSVRRLFELQQQPITDFMVIKFVF